MPRRNPSVRDLMIDLPWPVGIAMTALSYLLLHQVAPRLLMGSPVPRAVGQALMTFAPFVAGAFALATLLSLVRWLRDRQLYQCHRDLESVCQLNWREFERFMIEAFRREGYHAVDTPGRADGGVDLILTRSGSRFYVQCKHWKSRQVGVAVVRQLYGVISADGVSGGFVVTAGSFSEEARQFASGTGIELIDGDELADMILRARDSVEQHLHSNSAVSTLDPEPLGPACPKCGEPMVKRLAVRGRYAGEHFWGCSAFPGCRRTLDLHHAVFESSRQQG